MYVYTILQQITHILQNEPLNELTFNGYWTKY